MLYQRRSTTFELMSRDESAGGSGSGGTQGGVSAPGTSTGSAAGASDDVRKHSSRRHHALRISTGSGDGSELTDSGSGAERVRRNRNRRSNALLEVDNDARQARHHHRDTGESKGTRKQHNKDLLDLSDTGTVIEVATDMDIVPQPSPLMHTLHPNQYLTSRASCSSMNSLSSVASRRCEPTVATTISEMIADDYANDDDDSFAIFRDDLETLTTSKPRLRYDYNSQFEGRRKEKSRRRGRSGRATRRVGDEASADDGDGDRPDSAVSDTEENLLLPERSHTSSNSSRRASENEEDHSSFVGEELDELEQYEIGDRLGELMPVNYGRRNRREGVASLTRQAQIGSWDTWDTLSSEINDPIPLEFSSSENQSKNSEDEESDEQSRIRKYAKLILPHVGLVVLTCVYTLVGASIFYNVENPNEMATKRHQLNLIYAQQSEFVSALLRLAGTSNRTGAIMRDNWTELARVHMHAMSDQLFIAFDKYFLTSYEVKRNTTKEIWTFSTALFFSVTVVTTIGYGNPVPVTQLGRMMCIGFSLFGIPLTLVTIADMGKFLSERLIWAYGKYLLMKYFMLERLAALRNKSQPPATAAAAALRFKFKERPEHVCNDCQHRGLTQHMHVIEEQRIPALLVFSILVLYTALGGVLMSLLEPWSFFTSFYWSFITMTTVGFGDLMPRRDQYMYLILLYIILGLAITTMCIDLVGVQYIRKIHYFGRKIQDARSALAVVGGKVVLVSELYANLMQKRARNSVRDAFIIDNLYVSKHVIPYIPSDIRFIRYIDDHRHHRHRHHHHHQQEQNSRFSLRSGATLAEDGFSSMSTSTASSLRDLSSCRFCHSRFSISNPR